jgi:hypothetical protein
MRGNTERAGATADAADEIGAALHVVTLRRGRAYAVAVPHI